MSEKQQSCGALWKNTSKKGEVYLSGNVEIDGVKHKIVVFKNTYKDDEKKPDYRIYPSQPMQGAQSEAPKETFEDDIPF
jgi:uncharacterized protein (DUF736 family)